MVVHAGGVLLTETRPDGRALPGPIGLMLQVFRTGLQHEALSEPG